MPWVHIAAAELGNWQVAQAGDLDLMLLEYSDSARQLRPPLASALSGIMTHCRPAELKQAALSLPESWTIPAGRMMVIMLLRIIVLRI